MPTTDVELRETKFPTKCPHCHQLISSPPAWLRILVALAPGRGNGEKTLGIPEIARLIEMSRQRATILVREAVTAGALEQRYRVYSRTEAGKAVLNHWVCAGWR